MATGKGGKNSGTKNHAYKYNKEEDRVKPLCWDYKGKRTTFLSKPTRYVEHRPDLVTCGSCKRILDM